MEYLEKKIQINENRILIFSITEGYAKPTFTIMEGFLENGNVIKTYSLSQWDDYGLNGWSNNNEDLDRISFEFDMNHPLFFPFFHLLDYDDELLIDDDDTREKNKKYMLVHREKDKVYIDFINELTNDKYMTERFHVFIKNIVFDGRSKVDLDKKDTKERLFAFFSESYNVVVSDYHQISIEEWLLRNNIDEECMHLKRVFKKI